MTRGRAAWKAKHIALNLEVSFTVTIPKRIPFLPFLEIPAAVTTFQGTARILDVDDVDQPILARLLRGMEVSDDFRRDTAGIEIAPVVTS